MSKIFQWDQFVSEVIKRIPPQQYKAWLEHVCFIELSDQHLILSTPTNFSREWIQDHYQEILKTTLQELYGLSREIKVVQESKTQSTHAIQQTETLTPPTLETAETKLSLVTSDTLTEEKLTALSVKDLTTPVVKTIAEPLNHKHFFETFVVGASNQFAHAAARAVAEQPASQYNPLFIYSVAGLGKTHLLHAIGNYFLRTNPKAKICYLSAEKFVNDLIEAIRHEKMSQFRQKYRDSYDMLLMDDIQFIGGKDRTQEEFFHTFNTLHSSRRQIVVSSDKPPKEIPGLEDRIRSRFEWGLIADIQPPEIETRIAILRAKAEMDDLFLPNDVALFLATNIVTNVRELEGALIKLGAQASLLGVEISLDLAKTELSNIIKNPTQVVTADLILQIVAKHFSINVVELRSKQRNREVALPRQIAMYLLRKYCDKSYTEIGILLGGKDHSTVVHGVKTISLEIEKNTKTKQFVQAIQNNL